MAQAPAPNSPRSSRRSSRAGARKARSGRRVDTSVPELLARRQAAPPPPKRRPWQAVLLPFALGLGLGYGLASPTVRQLPSLLAGLIHAPQSLAAVVNPMASGNRRVLVMGRDKVGDNTDVMFTVQVKDGITLVTQVPRDTFVETDRYGTIKANALFALGGADGAKEEVAKLIGSFSRRAVEELGPFLETYGASPEDEEADRLRRTVFPEPRAGSFGLLRDLHALHLLVADALVARRSPPAPSSPARSRRETRRHRRRPRP